MEAIKISLGIYALAIACGFFIALVLMIMGRAVKYLDLKDDHEAAIPKVPAGQIMPKAGSDFTAIAVAIAAAKRESAKKE